MRKAIVFLTLLATPSFAQQYPPARDLNDAQKLVQEVQAQTQPLFRELRQEADVLGTIARARKHLESGQRAGIDDALETIEEFIRREEAANRPLTREMLHYLLQAKAAIEKAKITASEPDITATREYLHFELIHPLQVRMATNATQMLAFEESLQRLISLTRQALSGQVGAAAAGSRK